MAVDHPRPSDIRQASALSCIQAWQATHDPLTIAELARVTGLSRPTIDAVIDQLLRQDLISELSADGSGAQGGRPARRFRFEARSGIAAGIEAAPDHVSVVLADLRGSVLARVRHDVGDWLTAVQRLGVVVAAVRDAAAVAGVSISRLKAACVGVSGIVGHDGKLSRSYFVPDWNNTDIARRLAADLGCVVVLENDIKLAAYAEHHLGAAQLAPNSLYFRIGPNIAFAITINGKIHQGAHRSAGELASLRGMRWTSNTIRGELDWTTAPTLDGVVALAEQGDPAAVDELETFVNEIATRVASVSLVIDPDIIVVSGQVAALGVVMDRLRDELERLMLVDSKPGVLSSSLSGDGTLIGALALAFQDCAEPLYGTPGLPVPELTMLPVRSASG